MMAPGFVSQLRIVIYSLLIVTHESKIGRPNKSREKSCFFFSSPIYVCIQYIYGCVSSCTGHLGTLPSLFIDQAVGCDHDHGETPSFSAPENGSIVTGHHGAQAQLVCAVHELNHRAVSVAMLNFLSIISWSGFFYSLTASTA